MSTTDGEQAGNTTGRHQEGEERPTLWRAFATANGHLSVARLQIALGICYLTYPLLSPAIFRGAVVDAPHAEGPVWALLVGLIILTVGGIGLVLEARVERVPSPALWPARLDTPAEGTQTKPYWLDIAVLQLALGTVLVPVVALTARAVVPGWRIVAITVVSEIVYLAYLGARLVQKQELGEVLGAIDKVKKSATPKGEEGSKTEAERGEEKDRQEKLRVLEVRAALLMTQLGLGPAALHSTK